MNPLLTVASYNVQIPTVKTEQHNWDDRKHQLLPHLHELGDVLALQEVSYKDQNQGEEISTQLTRNGFNSYQPAHHPSTYTDEFHNRIPLYWKQDKFTLLHQGQLLLTTGTPQQQVEYPNMEARYCTYIQLQDRNNPEQTYSFFNVHQQQIPDDLTDQTIIEGYQKTQWEGLRNLESYITQVTQPGNTVFALGDFNSSTPNLQNLNCAEHTATLKLDSSYDSYHGYRTPYPQGRKNLDHIFTNLTPKNILTYETCIHYAGSDHHPIRVTIAE